MSCDDDIPPPPWWASERKLRTLASNRHARTLRSNARRRAVTKALDILGGVALAAAILAFFAWWYTQ